MSATALVIDHHDSFVFNLVEDLERAGLRTRVVRSSLSPRRIEQAIEELRPRLVVLSPGPGHPEDAGHVVPFLRRRPAVPILGVCLGMQAMACALGGRVEAAAPVHGRSSRIVLGEDPAFAGLGSTLLAGRYHSLRVQDTGDELTAIAWTEESSSTAPTIMALRHRELRWWGLQFHPESLLSPQGPVILENILRSIPT